MMIELRELRKDTEQIKILLYITAAMLIQILISEICCAVQDISPAKTAPCIVKHVSNQPSGST